MGTYWLRDKRYLINEIRFPSNDEYIRYKNNQLFLLSHR